MKRQWVTGTMAVLLLFLCWAGQPVPADECSVTATGWVHSSEFGSFEATITVTGPCDASLADKMRKAIAELRAGFK